MCFEFHTSCILVIDVVDLSKLFAFVSILSIVTEFWNNIHHQNAKISSKKNLQGIIYFLAVGDGQLMKSMRAVYGSYIYSYTAVVE